MSFWPFTKKKPSPPALPVAETSIALLQEFLTTADALAREEMPWRGGQDDEFRANVIVHALQGAHVDGLRWVIRQSPEWQTNWAQWPTSPAQLTPAAPYTQTHTAPIDIQTLADWLYTASAMYQEEFPRHRVTNLIRARYVCGALQGLDAPALRRLMLADGPDGAEGPTVITSTRRLPAGKVRLQDRTLWDDNGPFLGITSTHMDAVNLALTDVARFHDNIDFLSSMGMDQRVLGILGWDGDERVDPRLPEYSDTLGYVIDYAYEAGVRTELTVFADLFFVRELHSQSGRMAHATKIINLLKGREHKITFLEGCNEPGNGDLWSRYGTPQQLVDVVRYIGESLGLPYAAGALYGGPHSTTAWHLAEGVLSPEAITLIDGCPMASMHLDRGLGIEGLWRPIRQPWEALSSVRHKMEWRQKAWVNNEPIGHDSSVEWFNNGGAQRNTPMQPTDLDLHRLHTVATFMAGAALHNWHTEGGTGYSSDRPIRHEPGAAETMAAIRALPADLPSFDFHNWHWPSNPVRTLDGCVYDRGMKGRGTLRTISATNGGRVVIFPYCVLDGATLKASFGMQLDKLLFVDGEYRKVDTLDLSEGQTFEVERTLDALFVGRFK